MGPSVNDFESYDNGWRDEAACRGLNPDLFFPVGDSGPALERLQKAIAVCALCVVREECLTYALETKQDHGVWGGTSEEERRKTRKQKLINQRAG